MSPTLVQSRWRGRVLRSWALSPSPPNICKPLLVSPFPPPVVTTSALSIEESEEGAIARRGKSGTNGRRTDGRTDGRTCAKAVSRRCSFQRGLSSVLVRAQRKKTSQRKQKETTASSSEYVRFQRELLFFEDLPLSVFFFFAYTIYSRIGRTRTLAIIIHSAMIRARVTFSNLFLDRFMRLSLVLAYSSFRNFSLSNSLPPPLSFSSPPSIH